MTLLPDNFSLHFHPTLSTDTAEYYCLVNDRHSPEAIIDLLVQGKRISDALFSRSKLNADSGNLSPCNVRHRWTNKRRMQLKWNIFNESDRNYKLHVLFMAPTSERKNCCWWFFLSQFLQHPNARAIVRRARANKWRWFAFAWRRLWR